MSKTLEAARAELDLLSPADDVPEPDWADVRRRAAVLVANGDRARANPADAAARRSCRHWLPRIRSGRIAVAGAVVASVVVAAPALALREQIVDLFRFSNGGETPKAEDLSQLQRLPLLRGGNVEPRLLAERDGIRFFVGPPPADGSCHGLALVTDRRTFGLLRCSAQNGRTENAAPVFPSARLPIADFSSPEPRESADGRGVSLSFVAGFAADGVASVSLVDEDGTIKATIPVHDNVYATREPAGRYTAIVARAGDGRVLYRRDLTTEEEYSR